MKRKIFSVLLCLVMAVMMITGCGSDDVGNNHADTTLDEENTDDANAEDDRNTDDANEEDDGNSEDVNEGGAIGEGKKVALAMPTQSAQRWIDDAANMKKELEAKGYTVTIQFAEDDPKQQASQIEKFIADQVDCIVIVAVDSRELIAVEESAKNAGIPIIAYDRLLMDTDAVSFYATFDNKGIGTMIGLTIIEKAGLEDLPDGEYKTIEFFMGSPDDNNARFLYNGLMEALQPYLDNGKLVCKTGRTSFEDTCILRWSQETAQQWCKNYLAGYYTNEELDICATVFDGFAYGCREALLAAGYTAENWPIISGQDCETVACKNILDDTQAFSVFKDTRLLAEKCVAMIDAVISGMEPEINDIEQYNNNKLIVPTYLCTPIVVDKDNLQKEIIDSGYYTTDQILEAE